jgi:tricorn protease
MPVTALLFLLLLPAAVQATGSPDDAGSPCQDAGSVSIGGVIGAAFPALSPDGKTLAFAMYGDIWLVGATGGYARRITLSQAYDTKPRWSPDGRLIAFSSKRAGNYDIWVVTPEKGSPRQITYDYAFDSISEWSRDGRYIYFHSNRDGRMNVWRIPSGGGLSEQMTVTGGRDVTIAPDGGRMIFSHGLADLSRKQYRGSSNWNLFALDRPGQVPRPITTFKGNDRWPLFAHDGKACFFLSEKNGWYNIYSLDLATGKETPVTSYKGSDVRTPFLSFDGATLLYAFRDALWRTDTATGKTAQIPFTINADLKGPAYIKRTVTEGAEQPDWSPDGLKMAFQLRGDLWVMPSSGGPARRITSGADQDQWPRFSPDGKQIAFFSDRSGNKDIWIMPSTGGKATQLTSHKADDFFHSWSPDKRSIVFCSERSGNKDVWIIDVSSRVTRRMTRHPTADDDPIFSPDGKNIVFDSGRTGSQNIYVMASTGGTPRRLSRGRFDQLPSCSPDGRFIAYEVHDIQGQPSSIWVMRADGSCRTQIAAHGSGPRWAPSGRTVVFERQVDKKKVLYTVEAPSDLTPGMPLNFMAITEVDLVKERLQAFEEAWRHMRDSFYDPKMHGIDWKAVHKRYLPLARNLRTDEELISLINRMLGELKASHMGFWGRTPQVRNPAPPTGYLGMRLARTKVDGPGSLTVLEVMPGGPADKVWIRKGDHIFSVGGKKVGATTNIAKILSGRVGKAVSVRVGPDADKAKSRRILVGPISWMSIRALRYRKWVSDSVNFVRRAGRGKVGYIHLRMMGDKDLAYFKKALAGSLGKTKALILDIRNNGGGHIHTDLMDIFTRRPFGAFHPRGGKRTVQPRPCYTNPVVVLINEKSFSDAEVFPHAFKTLKRGKVVGVPTNGGVIGTGSATLINGFTLRLPRVGWFSLKGENLEGRGVQPDILVKETLEDRMKGRDPQLKKALEILLAEMKGGSIPETTPIARKATETREPAGEEYGRGNR